MDKEKYRGGFRCKGEGRRDGSEYKRGNNQEDQKRGGGLCPGCVREEKFPSSIWRRSEKRDKCSLTVVSRWERAGRPRGRQGYIWFLPNRTRLIVNYRLGPCLRRRWHVWKRNAFVYILFFVFFWGDIISKYDRETGDERDRPRPRGGVGVEDFWF